MKYNFNDEILKVLANLLELKVKLLSNESDKNALEFLSKLTDAIEKYSDLKIEEKYRVSQILNKAIENTAFIGIFNTKFNMFSKK